MNPPETITRFVIRQADCYDSHFLRHFSFFLTTFIFTSFYLYSFFLTMFLCLSLSPSLLLFISLSLSFSACRCHSFPTSVFICLLYLYKFQPVVLCLFLPYFCVSSCYKNMCMVTASVETNIVPSLFEKLMPAASSLRFYHFLFSFD